MLSGKLVRCVALGALAFALVAPAPALSATEANEAQATHPDTQSTQDQALAKRRERLAEDAVAALAATREAIEALDAEDAKRALTQLEVATGKLDLLVARNPEAAALPVDVDVAKIDVIGPDEEISAIIEAAEEALDDGRVQVARQLLTPLGSEIVFTTTELPLAAYPEAMRLAAPLIDEGRIDEARAALVDAIDTLIVRREIVPLPVLRAELLLALAEEQIEAATRATPAAEEASDDASAPASAEPGAPAGSGDVDVAAAKTGPTPAELLADARKQIERADVLGYGEAKRTYPQLVERLEKLEGSLSPEPDRDWTGRLARLRESIGEFGSSLLQ